MSISPVVLYVCVVQMRCKGSDFRVTAAVNELYMCDRYVHVASMLCLGGMC